MKNCNEYKELLPLALYPDSDDREIEEVLKHIEECDSCRKELKELENMKLFIDQREKPLMSDDYWEEFSDKLDDKLDKEEEKSSGKVITLKRTFYPLTAAALVMFGIYIGQYMSVDRNQPPSPLPLAMADSNQKAEVTPAVSRHFDSLTPLLLECANYQSKGDITLERKDVRSLLLENRILKQIVAKQNNMTEKQLLEELEIILMELSNSSPEEAGNIVKESGIIMKMKTLTKKSVSL